MMDSNVCHLGFHNVMYLIFYCSTLSQTLKDMDLSSLTTYTPGEPQSFAKFLDKAIGLVWGLWSALIEIQTWGLHYVSGVHVSHSQVSEMFEKSCW